MIPFVFKFPKRITLASPGAGFLGDQVQAIVRWSSFLAYSHMEGDKQPGSKNSILHILLSITDQILHFPEKPVKLRSQAELGA